MNSRINTEALIGKPEAEVVAYLKDNGCVTRVLSRDGVAYAGTCDYRLDRYTLSVCEGKVTGLKVG